MSKEKKKDLKESKKIHKITLVLIMIVIILLILLYVIPLFLNKKVENKVDNPEPKVYFNTNSNIVLDKELNGLKFSNIVLVYEDGQSKLIMDITNNTGNDYTKDSFTATLKDEEDKEIISLIVDTNGILKNGETQQLMASTNYTLLNATSMEIIEN